MYQPGVQIIFIYVYQCTPAILGGSGIDAGNPIQLNNARRFMNMSGQYDSRSVLQNEFPEIRITTIVLSGYNIIAPPGWDMGDDYIKIAIRPDIRSKWISNPQEVQARYILAFIQQSAS